MSDFPPKCWQDVETYDQDDIVEGYRDWRPDDMRPGDNHPPGYRWGWQNAWRDHTGESDGFEQLRSDLIRNTDTLAAMVATRH